MKLFESLKRLLEPRTRPPMETVGEATADRPPPPKMMPVEEAAPEVVAAVDDDATDASVALDDTTDVSEVRALLEAVGDPPVAVPETRAETPPTPAAPLGTSPPTARAGEALILTLANPAATFTVAKTAATIGRGEENTIRLDDLSVSRRHARVAWKQGGYWLSDLGSMGGTWVHGSRLNAPHRIVAGDVIDIGLCRLTVDSAGGAAEGETKKSAGQPRSELAESRRRR
jgi:FHA domain-containing protein